MNGDHGNLPPFDDALESLAKREETPRPGNLPFGKDTDDFTFIQPATGLAEGMENVSRRPAGRNGNGSHDTCRPMQQRKLVVAPVNEKPNRTIDTRQQQHPIHKRHVVRQQ